MLGKIGGRDADETSKQWPSWPASPRARRKAQTRSEVPIKEVALSDSVRRYSIPVTVGGTAIEAGLDTGSTGLRILPAVLSKDDALADGCLRQRGLRLAGTRIAGKSGHAKVAIGGLSASITVQLIDSIGCIARIPNCPASRIALSQFGMQGDGLPGEGFRAIIGVNMAEAEVASPLSAIGAKRWIVELPRLGAGTPGKLVLNPATTKFRALRCCPSQPPIGCRRVDCMMR